MELIKKIEQFQEVLDLLEDKKSKDIYEGVVLYNYTGKYRYLHNIIKNCCDRTRTELDLCSIIENNKEEQKEEIIVFGSAIFGENLVDYLREFGIKVAAFCDNDENKQSTFVSKVPVISPDELMEKHPDCKIIIAIIDYFKKVAVREQLLNLGIKEEQIVYGLSYYGNQYFEKDIMVPSKQEVFVDGGSLDAVTCKFFIDWAGGDYNKIYTFEPDSINRENCKANIERFSMKNVELLPYGLWNEKTQLCFFNAGGGSSINELGTEKIDTITIDEVIGDKPCTFIKMDIEGAELNALIGAKETIKKNHPKLAISIYHKNEDMLEIPLYIRQLDSTYKFYIRHHSSVNFETTLYAI